MKIAIRIAVAVIVIYGALCAVFYFLQDRFIYYPMPEVNRPGAQSFRLKNGDAVVKVWVLHPGQPQAVIYFGGNADDVGASLPAFSATFPDQTVYLVNYRGYGGSTGKPSEAALVSDARAVYDRVAPRHDHITVMGRSLGTGVATALAATRPAQRLILVTPYDSLSNVAEDDGPWLLPVRWLMRDPYNSAALIAKVRVPVLVIVAEKDQVIRRARSDALIAAIPAPLRHTALIKGATHNDLALFLDYLRAHEKLAVGD